MNMNVAWVKSDGEWIVIKNNKIFWFYNSVLIYNNYGNWISMAMVTNGETDPKLTIPEILNLLDPELFDAETYKGKPEIPSWAINFSLENNENNVK